MKKLTVKSTTELQKKIRHTWEFKPFTRVAESKKVYSRAREKQFIREEC